MEKKKRGRPAGEKVKETKKTNPTKTFSVKIEEEDDKRSKDNEKENKKEKKREEKREKDRKK